MNITLKYGKNDIVLKVPADSTIYTPGFNPEYRNAGDLLLDSITNPIGSLPLNHLLKKRKDGNIAIVVSDITRPIPYYSFLLDLLNYITATGVPKNEIVIIVATGMHRASTLEEKISMFGEDVVKYYQIVDHDAENNEELVSLKEKSWSGAEIKLNKHYVEAGFRILTGLVEPHFMAGFSGGRKSICPGLAALETIQMFHGYQFLSNSNASNAVLEDNPCHLENTSIAQICPADFSINVVLDQKKQLNKIISGEQFISHEETVNYVKEKSCKTVDSPADIAITSSGGYPLDATFYQCVKGFVNCLPAIKENGEIIAFGGCEERIGSPEYESIMKKYATRYKDFIDDIRNNRFFIKDQWQFQMHIRVLEKIGIHNLHFYTSGVPQNELDLLSVNGHFVQNNDIADLIQEQINEAVASGKKIAVFPEGPYCSAIKK